KINGDPLKENPTVMSLSRGDDQQSVLFPDMTESPVKDLPQAIVDLYHQICPTLKRVDLLDDDLKRTLRTRAALFKKAGNDPLTCFKTIFSYLACSDWHNGENPSGWKGSLRWLVATNKKFLAQWETAESL